MSAVYPAWSESIDAVAKHHGTSLQTGLSAKQVAASREAHGFNELPPEETKSMWKLVLEQFDDNLVKVSLLSSYAPQALIRLSDFHIRHPSDGRAGAARVGLAVARVRTTCSFVVAPTRLRARALGGTAADRSSGCFMLLPWNRRAAARPPQCWCPVIRQPHLRMSSLAPARERAYWGGDREGNDGVRRWVPRRVGASTAGARTDAQWH